MIKRYLSEAIFKDLQDKMVFIGGPRQVGKTTLSNVLVASQFRSHAYFNWDQRENRKAILDSRWPAEADLIVLDEIHKFRKWKTLLKGEYDTLKGKHKFLVTGSARLDVYRRGSDSLQGRYHYYRLHPFSMAEYLLRGNTLQPFEEIALDSGGDQEVLERLLKFGGFPEPFMGQEETGLRRWQNERIERLFREDIRDMENIRDLENMKLLGDLLPGKAGSLLSANSLREDLEVSHKAVAHWLAVLEAFYYHYRIYPFAGKKIRSIKKEPKLYLWDWSEVPDEAARFENMVGSHLLKLVHYLHDREGHRAELYYLRNVNAKEVDFLVTVNNKPWFAVEVKLSDPEPSPALRYYRDRMSLPFAYQVIKTPGINVSEKGVRVVSADRFLAGLV